MASQTKNGKAFEYACLKAAYNSLKDFQNVLIEASPAVSIAENFYNSISHDDFEKMNLAAQAAIRIILKLEPQLKNHQNNTPLYLSIQGDACGKTGDVRDILCFRKQNEWEIGFSCKHNHSAVKHSRLSDTIDFGSKWFDKPCSDDYFRDVKPLFNELKELRALNVLWRDLAEKEERFYMPLLTAFTKELSRLDKLYPTEIPPALIAYLLGRSDFYKIIQKDASRTTEIQPYNLFGTLNRAAGSIKPLHKIPQIKLPTKIFDTSFKKGSKNTIILTCDYGWVISLRIHNASSKVEPSLKFDVNLVGTPNLGFMIETW